MLDEHVLEKGSRVRVGAGRAPIHVMLKPQNRGRRQPDVAVSDPAGSEVYVSGIERQRFEIRDRGWIVEETNRHDIRTALEIHDVAVEIDERLFAPVHADGARGAHLTRSCGAQTMRHDFAHFELGEFGRSELELLREQAAKRRRQIGRRDCCRDGQDRADQDSDGDNFHGFGARAVSARSCSAACRLKSRSSGAHSGSIGASMTCWRSCRASAVLC